MNVQEPEDVQVLTIWVKKLSSIVKKMNNTKLSIFGMKPKNAIKLGLVKLVKFEKPLEENLLPEDS